MKRRSSFAVPVSHGVRHRRDTGAVLVELIVVIPLLAALMGGALWLMEGSLHRQRLVVADRILAWNAGNRHGGDPDAYRLLWGAPTADAAPGTVARVDAEQAIAAPGDGWWHVARGRAVLAWTVPVWVTAWLAPARVILNADGPDGDGVRLHGRVPARAPAGVLGGAGHTMLARTPLSAEETLLRNRPGRDLADALSEVWLWERVVKDPWPPAAGATAQARHEGKTYARWKTYRSWSE